MSQTKFHTAKGAEVTVEIKRNQKISLNGKWTDSDYHTIAVYANGNYQSFDRAEIDPEHGYSLQIGAMGKITVPVPTDSQDAVAALIAERDDNNRAVCAEADAADAAYQAHHDKIEASR